MAQYSVPKDSEYYWGEDGTYRPAQPKKKKPPRQRVEWDLDANGMPVRKGGRTPSSSKGSGRGMANLGPNYKKDETAATIVAASHNRLAAGANPEARRILGIGDREYNGNDAGGGGGNSSRDTEPPRRGADVNAKGTQMGGIAALADFDAFESRLGDLGINFNFGTSQLPTSGNHHQKLTEPGQNQDGTYQMPEYVMYQGQAVPTKEVFGNDYQGGYYGTAKVGNTADKSDVSRALDFGDDGDDEDSMLYNNYGNEEPIEDEYGGYEGRDMNARSRAFLDHPGGSMMALRAAEAAQGTIRQNGNTYGKNSEGKWVRLSKDAESALKNDGNLVATANYVTDNTYKAKPSKDLATETLSKHLEVNKQKLSHGEYLDLTNEGPLSNEENVVSFTNGKTFTMEQLNNNEDLWNENY